MKLGRKLRSSLLTSRLRAVDNRLEEAERPSVGNTISDISSTSRCDLVFVLLWIELQINKIEAYT